MSERTVSTAQRGRMLASTIGKPVLFAVLMWLASAAGEISIPGTPVPITLQTFVMMLAGLMLSWRQAGSAVVLYLAAGAAGLPVFAGGASTAALFGPSAGFLIGFLPAVIVTALLRGKARLDSAPHAALTAVRYFGASLAGNLVVLYLFGITIQSMVMHIPFIGGLKWTLHRCPAPSGSPVRIPGAVSSAYLEQQHFECRIPVIGIVPFVLHGWGPVQQTAILQ